MIVNVARHLWGPVILPAQRRVMQVLLYASLNDDSLSVPGITYRAKVRTSQALKTLAKLDRLNWSDNFRETRHDGRAAVRFHYLTGDGGARVAELLGMIGTGDAREVTA